MLTEKEAAAMIALMEAIKRAADGGDADGAVKLANAADRLASVVHTLAAIRAHVEGDGPLSCGADSDHPF